MKITLSFEKDCDNRWYAVIPDWDPEYRDELEMVCGADVMCDIFAQGENYITRTLSTESIENAEACLTLMYEPEDIGGAVYYTEWRDGISAFEVWLCDVTKSIFGEMPKYIYIK